MPASIKSRPPVLGNLVLVVSSVDAQSYKPVPGLDRMTCDSYLVQTLVFNTCIHQESIAKVLTQAMVVVLSKSVVMI